MSDHRLHVMRGSAPCRSVLLTLEILGAEQALDVEIVDLDLSAGAHLRDDYLALNPLHTVPTLECVGRGGLRESRSIMRYLCELAVAQSLYPEDPWERAQVDAMLDWDIGTFYKAIAGFVYPQVFRDELPDADAVQALRTALAFLDGPVLEDMRPYLIGARMTLADLSVACGLSMLELCSDDLLAENALVKAFYTRMQALEAWDRVNAGFYEWKARVRAPKA